MASVAGSLEREHELQSLIFKQDMQIAEMQRAVTQSAREIRSLEKRIAERDSTIAKWEARWKHLVDDLTSCANHYWHTEEIKAIYRAVLSRLQEAQRG